MVPSLLSWQGRCTLGNPKAAFHTKAQNVPAFLFPKVPPASCAPHTDLLCVLCRSPILSRWKPSTIHMCISVPALDFDNTDFSFYPVGSLTPTACATNLPSYAVVRSTLQCASLSSALSPLCTLYPPPPGRGLLTPNLGRHSFSCLLQFQGRVSQLYCLASNIKT